MREHQPMPPAREGAQADAVGMPSAAARQPLPAGAARWATVYVDADGVPRQSRTPVPVDSMDRRTTHVQFECPHTERADDGTTNLARVRCGHFVWLEPDAAAPYCPHHGTQLETAGSTAVSKSPLPWKAMGRAVEPTARPAWLLAGAAAVGISEQALQVSALYPAAATPALVVGAYLAIRGVQAIQYRRRDQPVRGRRLVKVRRRARAAAYLGATAGSWLTLVAATDPHTLVGATIWAMLPIAWAVGSATWWQYLARMRDRPAPPAEVETTAPVDEPPQEALDDAEAWRRDVAGGTPVLKHTAVDLDTWATDPGGRRMVVRATRGGITDEMLKQALPQIAGAFNVKRSAVGWVEEYEGSPRSLLLLVQPASPLNDDVPPRPIDEVPLDNAVVHMGMRIDGSDLTTRLFTLGWGAPGRFVVGTKGSGKTELIRRLTAAMLRARIRRADGSLTRLVAPFLHDPKRGADYGAVTRAVCGFSIESDTLHMIVDALIREMNRRYDGLAHTVWLDDKGRLREGEKPFDPTTMGPVISLIVDEFHEVAKDQQLLEKLEPMSRKMRAAGIEVTIASHMSTIGDTGSQVFRDMLAGGEAWLLRTTSGLNAALATGGQLIGDPRALPRVPGMVLQASGEGPTMQARVASSGSEGLYDELYDDANQPRFAPVDWPEATLEAFGSDFVEWMTASQNRPLGSGVPPVPLALRRKPGPVKSGPAGDARRAEDILRLILFEVAGPVTRSEVATHRMWSSNGYSDGATLTAAVRQAEDAGWLRRPKQGVYELTEAAREELAVAAEEMRDELDSDAA